MTRRTANGVPLYERTRQSVLELISVGTYGPGDRLPSESALAEQFGVHRLTARRALEELSREGLVVARKGSGTYVAPGRKPLPISVPLTRGAFGPSLRRQLTAAGRRYREVLLDIERTEPGEGTPTELRATGGLSLVRTALEVDGEFWVYSTMWVTRSRVTRIRRSWRESDGLYGVILDQVGELVSVWRSFQAEPASADVAEILGVRPGAAVIVREGLTCDAKRVPILYVRRFGRGDRVRYVVDYDNVNP
jgi:DNA-binding GntR family transcriptional regulator